MPASCVIYKTDKTINLTTTDTKPYAPVETLSHQNNTKLPQQSKSRFKRTFNWKKYQSKVSVHAQNQYLEYLIDPNFQEA